MIRWLYSLKTFGVIKKSRILCKLLFCTVSEQVLTVNNDDAMTRNMMAKPQNTGPH